MQNSLVTASFLHVLRGLLQDVQAAYPPMRGVTLDEKRISRICATRGPATYMLDLPNLDDLLLGGLETGRLSLKGPLSTAVSKRIRVPRLFEGLWLRVFAKDGILLPVPDVNAIAFLRQLSVLGKKIEVECTDDRKRAALAQYYDIERGLREPSKDWYSDSFTGTYTNGSQHKYSLADCRRPRGVNDLYWGLDTPCQEEQLERYRFLQRVQLTADIVVGALGPIDPIAYSGWLESVGQGIGFSHGPGAVSEKRKNWEKSQFLNWPTKLDGLFPFEECGKTASSDVTTPINHEPPARLLLVPKTAKAPRIIAAEPTSHMWCQQLVWKWLENGLRDLFGESFAAFRRQDLSAAMVQLASRDRELCTVDLSSASDRLSCWTVERVYRNNQSLLQTLHAARTRWLRVDVKFAPKNDLLLRKFASQGTATTFPVQTLVYLVCALACAMPTGPITLARIKKLRNQVRVYGDDIILPSHGYERLLSVLEDLQLKVNGAKSFVHGHFRESCGTDCYAGYDVTPAKPTKIVANGPKSYQAIIDVSNNLHKKGYWHASKAMVDLLPPRIASGTRIRSIYDKGIHGLVSYSGSSELHLEQRWNSELCRLEVKCWAIKPVALTSTVGERHSVLDFISKRSPRGFQAPPRVVSELRNVRESKMRLKWEPSIDENVTSVRVA